MPGLEERAAACPPSGGAPHASDLRLRSAGAPPSRNGAAAMADESGAVPGSVAADAAAEPGGGAATKKKKAPRRRRASVMEMLDEAGKETADGDVQAPLSQINKAGFDALCDKMGLRLNAVQRKRAFRALDTADGGSKDGMLDFGAVHSWARATRGAQLRAARKLARTLFDMADDDSSGFLDKGEVIQVKVLSIVPYPAGQ